MLRGPGLHMPGSFRRADCRSEPPSAALAEGNTVGRPPSPETEGHARLPRTASGSADLGDTSDGEGMGTDTPWRLTHLGEPSGTLRVPSAHPVLQKSKPPSGF